mmetsp:Transcript_45833/g.178152  ORF Transcript_45833/g.178152 Transcript_45833/m.178152 type:complete len:89 (-) Transcript_45833:430-696(-)
MERYEDDRKVWAETEESLVVAFSPLFEACHWSGCTGRDPISADGKGGQKSSAHRFINSKSLALRQRVQLNPVRSYRDLLRPVERTPFP